jgi:signal transduction histidine kinase
MILYQALVFLIMASGFWLASWVFFANRESKTNQLFSLFTISLLLWAPLPYFFNLPSLAPIALHLVKFGYGIVSLFLVTFYFFTTHFPREEKRDLALDKIVIVVGFLFFFMSVFTNLVVEDIELTTWGVNPIFGRGKISYFGAAFFLTVITMGTLFKKYFSLSTEERVKIQYVLIGLIIFVIPNLIFNVIFPFLGRTAQVRYYPLGNYSAIFLIGFTAYAIVKRELFGIKLVLTSLLVGLIAILILLDALIFTENLAFRLVKGGVLIIFIYFGYLLINSVLEEIKRREEIEKLSKAKSEFISIASHQLRTPLTAVQGYVSMILEGTYGGLPVKIKKPIKSIYQSNKRLIKLVNDLLDVSKIETGKIEIKIEQVSLEKMISGIVEELRGTAKNKGLYLKWNKPKRDLAKLSVDREKIRQSISNIVDNAIRYTNKGGVTINLKAHNSKLRITIKDTGVGLTKYELSKMFESFSRGAAGTRLYTEGVGLGLYIARRFVEMHGGKIWVESRGRKKGSTFYIELLIK